MLAEILAEIIGSILQGALEGIGITVSESRMGRLVTGILVIIFAVIVNVIFWSSVGPKQIKDLTIKRISYRTSYLKNDKQEQEIVLEGTDRKYWIYCEYWQNQNQAWELMEKLNSTSEAVVYLWKESSKGATIYGMTTPISLDPASSVAWSESNYRAGRWVAGAFYAMGAGLIVSSFWGKKSAYHRGTLERKQRA
jgi:hypothetical protein